MIHISNLSFTYPGSLTPQLDQVNLDLHKGEFVAVIGENGCGKSTLCKAVNGLIPHYFSGDYQGSVEVSGSVVENSSISHLAQKVGYVYQDFENQIVRPTLLDDASFASMNYAHEDYLERGKDALLKVGLLARQRDYIWQLSGGQKHLLALAGALALTPEILVLDEPIAQLDPAHATEIYDLLRRLNQEEEKTIIVIEHHSEFIAKYCSHVVMMNQGKVKWKLPVREALNRIDELQAVNVFPPQVTLAAHRILNGVGKEKLLPVTHEEGLHYFKNYRWKKILTKNGSRGNSKETVSLKGVKLDYATVKGPKSRIFDGLDLTLYQGENIGVVGNNGAGKTSLFKLMTGLVRPAGGRIYIQGKDMTGWTPEKIANEISLVYQNPEQMFISDSIQGDILHAMKARKIPSYEERGQKLMEQFDLMELKNRDGRLLSGGQMRRASLAIGIALQPSVLLLDEPTANLDIATRKSIIRMLTEMKGQVNTTVIASHDMQLIAEWADRILVLHQGQIIADGSREEIFGDEELMKIAGIVAPSIHELGKGIDRDSACFTVDEFVDYFQEEEAI